MWVVYKIDIIDIICAITGVSVAKQIFIITEKCPAVRCKYAVSKQKKIFSPNLDKKCIKTGS